MEFWIMPFFPRIFGYPSYYQIFQKTIQIVPFFFGNFQEK